MSATKILWGQILVVFAIVLVTTVGGDAMGRLAARLPAAARPPWFELAGHAGLSAAGLLLVVVPL